MLRMMVRLREARGDDSGMALATVLLVAALVTTLVITTLGMVMASLRSSTDHDKFEGAVAAAEAGVDSTLAQLQANQAYSLGPAIGGTFATPDAERQWAYTHIMSQHSSGSSWISTGSGEYLAIKPSDMNVIYALGCDPNCDAANAKQRLVKVEYLFAPYKPGNAILTSGDLSFSSSVTVDVTANAVGGTANVHTNGSATGTGCSQTVNGIVTASGGYSVCGSVGLSGSGGNMPQESVPQVKPRYIYDQYSAQYRSTWYDLCPDGKIRRPAATPCTGTQYADASGGASFQGWTWTAASGTTPALWDMSSTSWGSGIYYVYQGDANINRNTVVASATVIAEAAPTGGTSATCNKLGGNITAKLVTISNAALPGVVLVADGNLSATSHFEAGIGVFAAGDQIQVETSSNGITGTVIANDTCPSSTTGMTDQVKNAVINYDQNVEVPLLDIIRTTQWLELNPNAN